MAAAGTVSESGRRSSCSRTFTYWPGHSVCCGLAKLPLSCTVPLVVSIWLFSRISLPVPSSCAPLRS
jgi:hypothetical protein